MLRLLLLCGITFQVVTDCCADDAPIPNSPESIVRIYSVGDLVSIEVTSGEFSPGNRDSVAPETLRALNNLASIVESMCSQKPVAVRTYAPTLSLIVRHSSAGHKEIDDLLRSLGQADRCSIRMAAVESPTSANAMERINFALGKLLFENVTEVYFRGAGMPANDNGRLPAWGRPEADVPVQMNIYENYIVQEFVLPDGSIHRDLRSYEQIGRIQQLIPRQPQPEPSPSSD